jgi:hypothetical protein
MKVLQIISRFGKVKSIWQATNQFTWNYVSKWKQLTYRLNLVWVIFLKFFPTLVKYIVVCIWAVTGQVNTAGWAISQLKVEGLSKSISYICSPESLLQQTLVLFKSFGSLSHGWLLTILAQAMVIKHVLEVEISLLWIPIFLGVHQNNLPRKHHKLSWDNRKSTMFLTT